MNAPRKRATWPLGVLAGLVVLAAAGWAAVHFLLPPERVRAMVQAQLGSALQRQVRLGRVSLHVWPPVRARIEDVTVAQPGGFAHGTMLRVARFDLDLDAFAVLFGRLVVRRLILREPTLQVVIQPDGHTNLEDLMRAQPGPARGGPSLDVDVRELYLEGGRIIVDDVAKARRTTFVVDQRLALQLTRNNTRIATHGETTLSGYASGSTATTRLSQLSPALAALALRVSHQGELDTARDRLTLERIDLSMGKAALTLAGTVDSVAHAPRLDLRVTSTRTDLAEVLDWLSRAQTAALNGISGGGTLTLDLRVTGPVSPARLPALVGRAGLAQGRVRYPGAPVEVGDVAATAEFVPDEVRVPDLRANVGGQPLRAGLRVWRLADPQLEARLQGDVDLAAVGPLLAGANARLTGATRLDVRARGAMRDPAGMDLSGSVMVRRATVETPALPRKLENVSADLAFSAASAQVKGLSLSAGASSLQLNAQVQHPLALLAKPETSPRAVRAPSSPPAEMHFDLRSPFLDLSDIAKPGGGPIPVFPCRGDGKVYLGRFRNGKLEAGDVSADLALEPGVVRVTRYAFDAYGGRVKGDAQFDGRDAARPRYRVAAHVDSVQADALLSAWTPARGVLAGVLDGNIDLDGAGLAPADITRSLTAQGLMGVLSGRLAAKPLDALAAFTGIPELKTLAFKDLRAPFRVQNGRIITDDVVLHGPQGDWRMAGTLGLDGALDYAVSATLPPEVTARLPKQAALAAGALGDAQGRLLLDLTLGGSVKSPRLAWNPKAMQARLAGKLNDALAAQRLKVEQQAHALEDSLQRALLDSLRTAATRTQKLTQDSLKRLGRDFLRGFLPPAPPPTPAPSDSHP